jgi:hypothetical protein
MPRLRNHPPPRTTSEEHGTRTRYLARLIPTQEGQTRRDEGDRVSDHGYIYIKGWEDFQHPDAVRSKHMPWLKLYTDLLGNDDWLELRPVDRVLLMGVWMLTSRYGNGRVNADTKWLCAQLKIDWSGRYRGLERLSDAGFIQVLASKAASRHASKVASTEGEEGSKEPSKKEKENARANGGRSRAALAAPSDHESDPEVARRNELKAAIATATSWQLDGQPALEQTITEAWPDLATEIIRRLPAVKETA